jgi:hypothetical protein
MPLYINLSHETVHVTGDPRPVTEYQTDPTQPRKPRIDRATGQPVWSVPMFISGVGRVVDVKVAGEPVGVARDVPVRIAGLTVNHWRMDRNGQTREGIAYRAERIEPIGHTDRKAG